MIAFFIKLIVGLGLSDNDKCPHGFSGGWLQRISIVRALSGESEFPVCEEPTSVPDVLVQAQILNLLRMLQRDMGLTHLFVGHDLSVVRHTADEIAVLYPGPIVGIQTTRDLFSDPLHPYSRMLPETIPDPDSANRARTSMEEEVPSPAWPPPGCTFHPRCPLVFARWGIERPQRERHANHTRVACFAAGCERTRKGPPCRKSACCAAPSKSPPRR